MIKADVLSLYPIPVRMNSQLFPDVISKFETGQFQQINKNTIKLISVSGPGSDYNKHEPGFIPKGKNSQRKDKAGRILLGQQYVWALVNWLADYPALNLQGHSNNEIFINISTWLGNRSPQKEKLVRIIVAKLTHDWRSLKRFNHGSKNKGLAHFAYSMEIWNYTFPKMLNIVLQEIGTMEAESNDPDGSYISDKDEKTNIEKEFAILCNLMCPGTVSYSNSLTDKNDLI